LVEYADAHYMAVLDEQVGSELEFTQADGFDGLGLAIKGAADLASSGVAVSVQHPVAAVRTLARENNLCASAIELRAPFDQLFDALRTFFHQHASGFFVAQAVAGPEGVFQMQADFVVVAERSSDTALRVTRVRLRNLALSEAEHAARRSELHRSAQAGYARTNYDEIGFRWKSWHCGFMVARAIGAIHYTKALIRIPVQTPSRSYEVLVERGLLRSAAAALRDVIPPDARIFALTAPPIRRCWASALRTSFSKAGRKIEVVVMPDGERAKTLAQLEKLAAKLVSLGADRRSVLLALGGGVAGDVGAFLASIFMRGIPVVQIPTTLLAQVDSAVGGKTGVNLKAGKNLLGTFHQPLAVLADPDVLATLPEREYRSGLFEAMKYGVIRNPAIFDLMESQRDALLRRDGALLERLIADCIRVKAEVVSADERESGERRILNFGHTIGHALEAETNYRRLLHGEAVGWGMIAASVIGKEMRVTDGATAERIIALVQAYGPLPEVNVDGRRILKRLLSDKKTVGGVPHFVLATGIGTVDVVNNVPPRCLMRAVKEIRMLALSS